MGRRAQIGLACVLALLFLTGARTRPVRSGELPARIAPSDPFSFANADEITVRHVSLDLEVDFDTSTIAGSATLHVRNLTGTDELFLDTNGLVIHRVVLDDGTQASHDLLTTDPILGTPLRIIVRPDTRWVRVEYETSPDAAGLHWMTPTQAQQEAPYLYSQNETIDARSWIPVQDSPSVRMTWDASVRVPPGYLALMSAENPTATSPDGAYTFEMDIPIPAYLQSLAVSELEFRAIDERSGVYAVPDRIDAAHAELQVVPEMMDEAEAICGPYRWGRYDVLIMPPSYHIGGMEHPRLTFATPSFVSGDGSLVKLIAHELAHSWSGDQVTTATWNDIWINEGLTVYLELRIMEAIFGSDYEAMLAENSLRAVEQYVQSDPDHPDTRMHGDLRGRHPNEGFSRISYDKGGAFWRMLESGVGRAAIDRFLKIYFARYTFEWMDADALVDLIRDELLSGNTQLEQQLRIHEWVYETGLPSNRQVVDSARFNRVDVERSRFAAGTRASLLDTRDWSPHEYVYFLQYASGQNMSGRMSELEGAWDLDDTTNLSLLSTWSHWVAGMGHLPSFPAMERYLGTVGAGGGLVGVYSLLKNNNNASRATTLYRAFRPRYHRYAQAALDGLLEFAEKRQSKPGMPMPFKY
jgi:aminopeptidase N